MPQQQQQQKQQKRRSERFHRRLNRLYAHFVDQNDSAWEGADYLILQHGAGDDDDDDDEYDETTRCGLRQRQSLALFRWLFGSYSDSISNSNNAGAVVIVMRKEDGCVWFMVHESDKDWIETLLKFMPLHNNDGTQQQQQQHCLKDFTLLCHKGDDDSKAIHRLWKNSELLRNDTNVPSSSSSSRRVAILLAEQERNLDATSANGILRAMERRLQDDQESGRIKQLVDAALGITLAMAAKDVLELSYLTKACGLATALVKHGFQDAMLDCLDEMTPDDAETNTTTQVAPAVSHADLAAYLLDMFKDPARVSFRSAEGETYAPCYTPMVQSGGTYDLRWEAFRTAADDRVLTDDIVTVQLGASCEHYCSNVARTFLFHPSDSVRDIYAILLEMRVLCMAAMTPGQPLKAVYQAAVALLSQKGDFAYLRDHLPDSLGFGTGLVFREAPLLLTASNDIVFVEGMTFSVSFAFQNLKERRSNSSQAQPFEYVLVFSDTVKVTNTGAAFLSDMPCRLADIAYVESTSTCASSIDDDANTEDTSSDEDDNGQLPILTDQRELTLTVKRVYDELEKECDAAEYERLQQYLHSKRDLVLEAWRARDSVKRIRRVYPFMQEPRDPELGVVPSLEPNGIASNTNYKRPQFSVLHHRNGASSTTSSVSSIPIAVAESRLPVHSLCIPIRKSFWADDVKELAFVPSVGDAAGDIGDLLDMHDTTHRENLIAYGAECEQEQTNDKIDEMLRRVHGEIASRRRDGDDLQRPSLGLSSTPQQHVLATIADVMGEKRKRIKKRYEKLNTKEVPINGKAEKLAHGGSGSVDDLDERFVKATDSNRQLWCRRCYTYDCNAHGLRDKPSLATQLELALKKEHVDFWRKPDGADLPGTAEADQFAQIAELSSFQKSICKQMYSIFGGDVGMMSSVMRAPVSVIQEYIDANHITGMVVTTLMPPASKSGLPHYSVKHYKSSWYNRYRDAEIYPFFFPCYHDGKCSEDNCTCIQSRFFCTKACGWSNESPNFFRGCDCKGPCSKWNCTCFAAKRECDPNLCKCTGCTDPPGQPAGATQACRNDNILMQRGVPLLIGRSEISGWGLFTKHALKNGDFVGEYVGEAISQEEAERRGQIADAKECSYIFMVASDLNIDASRKGNKTRFMNHSDTPNVEQRTVFVQGEQRIGFYAKQDVAEQSELFFDYNYLCTRDNDLVLQTPATNVKWMKDGAKKKIGNEASQTTGTNVKLTKGGAKKKKGNVTVRTRATNVKLMKGEAKKKNGNDTTQTRATIVTLINVEDKKNDGNNTTTPKKDNEEVIGSNMPKP